MIRDAKVTDTERIVELINNYAGKGMMLPKTPYKIYSTIQNFFVIEIDGIVIGCAALSVMWKDLAEVCSLAVDPNYAGKGYGRILVEKALERAKNLNIPRVIALTYQDKFFEKLGFKLVSKDLFPRKLWRECLECPKLEVCDELAYVYDIV
ncbi:MAG: GNAT family N-acetyltransferase [Spirochaetes bacterium GWD1_27_9]|nr:MAG: GNAT family N-acetyltransferase [Spirochaetes bacterium GWC1_27_15]OHD33666.1 MAG: GNAT family N-acetyltransferase [Spirochaetes bacterium GWD1_27_9]